MGAVASAQGLILHCSCGDPSQSVHQSSAPPVLQPHLCRPCLLLPFLLPCYGAPAAITGPVQVPLSLAPAGTEALGPHMPGRCLQQGDAQAVLQGHLGREVGGGLSCWLHAPA